LLFANVHIFGWAQAIFCCCGRILETGNFIKNRSLFGLTVLEDKKQHGADICSTSGEVLHCLKQTYAVKRKVGLIRDPFPGGRHKPFRRASLPDPDAFHRPHLSTLKS
jgi:hypothetical protein